MMETQFLHQGWSMCVTGSETHYNATVPGSVYGDLLAHGLMEDPFWRDNEDQALQLMDKDYEYQLSFVPEAAVLQSERVVLHFDGLDTLASVELNGCLLGNTHNQHRVYEFDVKEVLHADENVLRITFASPTRYIKEMQKQIVVDGSSDAMIGFPHIRKAHCMFGWDWGPRLPDAGIWRAVSLLGIQTARIDSFYVTQQHSEQEVLLQLEVAVEGGVQTELSYTVTLCDPDGVEHTVPDSPTEVTVKNPQLWWPNGYGEQPLYTLTVSLYHQGVLLDTMKKRIGLRTMTMRREKDEWGESFAHEVNGVQIFAMGADYIPEDNLLGRVTPERTRTLLEQCKAAHFNAVRVWGGGYYPDDFFFDSCDELGLVVWQDMMFACAVYELTDDFEANITAELVDNVKRIRHHASLGLWCGNNEMEQFVDEWQWVSSHKQKADYIKMYEYIFPKILKQYDPNTFYWPASPSSGGSFDFPNDPNRGDVHYWEVWHGNKPFTDYRNFHFRYASEFGFQSFPTLKTVESFTNPDDRNVFSYIMEKHQRNAAANGKIMNYLYQTYRYPAEFGTLLYASQMLQAEAIKYGVEHWRRNRGRCMGAIYWQLNDCWPVASWASIDYFGRWKALHYYAKRFFAPLMLSCCEEGTMSHVPDVNAEIQEFEKSMTLSIANETMSAQQVTVSWQLCDHGGNALQKQTADYTVPALTSMWLDKVVFETLNLHEHHCSYELLQEGNVISAGSVIFCAPKHFDFVNPHLSAVVEGDTIVVQASAYAKGVEILNENEDLILSDNYFDMEAGERRVQILQGNPEGLKLRSVYDIR